MSEFTFACPRCRKHIAAEDEWSGMEVECPHCSAMIAVPAKVRLRVVQEAPSAAPAGEFEFKRRDNEFTITGSYPVVFALVHKALEENGCRIENSDPARGLLIVASPRNKNVKIYGIFSQRMNNLILEIHAADVTRRVAQCNVVASLIEDVFNEYKAGKVQLGTLPSTVLPPKYADREGVDYKRLSTILFITSFGGLLFCPLIIMSFVIHLLLLKRIGESQNKNGRGFAVAGLCIDMFLIFACCMYAAIKAGL